MTQLELFDSILPDKLETLITCNTQPLITFGLRCEYNRTQYPDDTYEIAAKKIFNVLQTYEKVILGGKEINITPQISIDAGEPKFFKITRLGIDHNYDLDLWHSWMVLSLHRLVREEYFYKPH